MASYVHFDVDTSLLAPWSDAMGTSYVATSSVLTITNLDGTLTKALGSFVVFQGTLLGGAITTLEHTSANGATIYENITGLALDAKVFVGTAPENKLDYALAGADIVTGSPGDDHLYGGAQNDQLYGGEGNDHLNGGTGADLMVGGTGNDTYYVDHPGDVVKESLGAGYDTVFDSVASYALPANVEEVILNGGGLQTVYANELDNYLSGEGYDTFYGLEGNDYFFGPGAFNAYYGGKGDDIYHVESGSDSVIELPGEGTHDIVYTSLPNYHLPANVEDLQLESSSGTAYGNQLDNAVLVNGGKGWTVYGLGGNDLLASLGGSDTLNGGDGDDTLHSSGGTDTLIGGPGTDTFVVGADNTIITDFAPGAHSKETIDLLENHPNYPSNFGQLRFASLPDVLAHATQVGSDTVIDLGAGGSLTLKNVQKGDLVADDFVGLTGGTPHWMASTDLGSHPAGWQPALTGDFNHDGASDLLWFNPATGDADLWKMSGGQWAGSADIGTHPAGYTPAASGDFNADGTSDALWYSPASGDAEVWKISNGSWAGSVDVGTHPAGWQVAGSGDFNADGASDVLWFNPSSGDAEVWKISNGQWAGSSDLGTHPAGYTPVGTGDFNGDGTSDVLWYNPTTHDVDMWKVSDGQWAGSVDVGTHPAGYAPVGVGDFNQDGTSDIVWFNAASGDTEVWLMADGHWSASVDLGLHPAGWSPAGVGDFDHNGTADILWQQNGTNHMETWLLANS